MRCTIAASFLVLFCAGCQVARSADTVRSFRATYMDMYTAQLLDNLVRAYNDLPIIQLKFSQLVVTQADSASLMGVVGDTSSNTRMTGYGSGGALSLSRVVGSSVNFTGNGMVSQNLAFHVDPVTDNPELYAEFRAFVDEKEGFFKKSSTEPPSNEVHQDLAVQRDGEWYYVTCGGKKKFTELSDHAIAAKPKPAKSAQERIDSLQETFEDFNRNLERIRLELR